jgi:hypothetical protein
MHPKALSATMSCVRDVAVGAAADLSLYT